MSRPKGSKNKATLAKELGMSLEEYQKKYNTSTDKDNTSSLKSTDNTTKVSKGVEHPNITSNTRFLVPKEGNNSLKSVKDKEEGAESTTHLNKDILNKTIKALEEVKYIQDTKEAKELSKIKSPSKGHIYCDRCHKEVLKDNTKTLDFSKLLGIGEYHFVVNHKVSLCHGCMIELANTIDYFLYNTGLGVDFKIPVEGEKEGAENSAL